MTGKNLFGETVYYIKPSKKLDIAYNERLKIEGEIIEKATMHKKTISASKDSQKIKSSLAKVVGKTTKKNANSLTENELKQLIRFFEEKRIPVKDINAMNGKELREKLISVAINYTIDNDLRY